jgi:hypothetical protein
VSPITQFGRFARVTVQNDGDSVGADSIRFESQVEGLRIQFKIEKSPSMVPNTSDISIYNLAESSRRRLKSVGALVMLEAGRPDSYGLIFKGNARTIDHIRQGPGCVTHIQCGDGELAYRFSQANQSFKSGTSFQDAATYLAKQLAGVDVSGFLSKLSKGQISGPFSQYVNGISFFGNAGEELERLMAAGGYQLSIQDHELVALKLTETSAVVVVLTPSTGLVASPEHGTPERSGLPSLLKAKALLQPRIRPGDRVRFENLRDDRITGDYRSLKVSHCGDTHGTEWYTDLELRPAAAQG